MALEGNLSSFGLEEILQLIAVQQKTGMLSVTINEKATVLFFRDGKIISTRDRRSKTRDPFREYLMRYGVLTREQLVRLTQIGTQSKLDLLDLSSRKLDQLELGFVVNNKAYAGHEVVDVVQYDNTMHTAGTVVTFINEGRDPHRVLRYQYKVQWRQPEDGSRRIELLNIPFCGIGTRNRIARAIYDIGFSTYRIPLTDLGKQPAASCVSDARADNQ